MKKKNERYFFWNDKTTGVNNVWLNNVLKLQCIIKSLNITLPIERFKKQKASIKCLAKTLSLPQKLGNMLKHKQFQQFCLSLKAVSVQLNNLDTLQLVYTQCLTNKKTKLPVGAQSYITYYSLSMIKDFTQIVFSSSLSGLVRSFSSTEQPC